MSAVPKQRLLTAEEFAALPREGLRTELVRGEVRAMAPAFDDHGEVAMMIGILIGQHVLAHGLGRLYAAETGFLIARDPDTVRAPDLAFIRQERVPPRLGAPGWVREVPDLVAEVVSSGDRVAEIAEKAQMWLDAGVRVVLVVWPARRVIEVHQPDESVLTLGACDTLEGYSVVEGLALPVAQIFG